jgi:hypothetical protein
LLRVISMLKEGKYAVWFRTPRGQGTGIVYIADGRISGSDSFFTYGGSYQVDDDHFTAVLTTRRHADGMPTLFGPDEVEVNLSGECHGTMAVCSGTASQAPEVQFEATLIYSQEDAPVTEATSAVVKLKADKLPKRLDGRPDNRLRPRPPVAPGFPRGPLS